MTQYFSFFLNWVIFKVVYEETMHTLYRFNTLLITRVHVISKRKHTKVRHQYCSYETMHWFELLTLYISDRVSEREEQGWFFGWNDPEMTLLDILVNYALKYQISSIETENIHLKLWKIVGILLLPVRPSLTFVCFFSNCSYI